MPVRVTGLVLSIARSSRGSTRASGGMASTVGAYQTFGRAFGSPAIARLILFGAFLLRLKVFNGNFVAATRMLDAVRRRILVYPSLARVHPSFGTPVVGVTLTGVSTIAASVPGDAIFVPISEVGTLAVGGGWARATSRSAGGVGRVPPAQRHRPGLHAGRRAPGPGCDKS